MALIRGIATVGGLTLASRLFGFVRDVLTAQILGAGAIADAFFVALKLPNFFRALFAEGAFAAAFVPMLSRRLELDGREPARQLAGAALAALMAIVIPFTLAFVLAMPWVIELFAPGFGPADPRRPLAVELSQVTFFYLPAICAVALIGGMLNSVERLAPFAATSIWFNIVQIAALLLLADDFPTVGHALAWAVFASGLVQLAWMLWSARRAAFLPPLRRPRLNADMRRLGGLIAPGMLGAGITQINLFVDMMLASLLAEGAVSYLYYADRLNQLPLGVIGIAIGTALLPPLTRRLAAGDAAGASAAFSRAVEICLALGLPAGAALMVIPGPVIEALFQRGAFGAADAAATAATLMAYASGLPALILVRPFNAAFFARQDTATPVRIGAAVALIHVALSVALIWPLAHVGIALATALSGWLNVILLALALRRRGHLALDRRVRRNTPRLVLATAAMVAALVGLQYGLDSAVAWPRLVELAVLVAGGGVVYLALTTVTGALSRSDLRLLRPQRGSADAARDASADAARDARADGTPPAGAAASGPASGPAGGVTAGPTAGQSGPSVSP